MLCRGSRRRRQKASSRSVVQHHPRPRQKDLHAMQSGFADGPFKSAHAFKKLSNALTLQINPPDAGSSDNLVLKQIGEVEEEERRDNSFRHCYCKGTLRHSGLTGK